MKRIEIREILQPLSIPKSARNLSLRLIDITLKNKGIIVKRGRYNYKKISYIKQA